MAFDKDDILKISQELAKLMKERADQQIAGKNPSRLIEPYEGYNLKVKAYDEIKVHSVYNVFPERLFKNHAPNQTQKEADYVENNYSQDLTTWQDHMNTVKKIFHKSNWSINYEETPKTFGDETFQDYVESNNFGDGMSLRDYVSSTLLANKERDAEGIVAVRPEKIPLKQVGDDYIIDPDILISPVVLYYDVTQVMNENTGSHVHILTNRNSVVYIGDKAVREGMVFEFYDNENVWQIKQVGQKTDLQFEIELFFNHDSGYVPATKNRGIPFEFNNKIIYHSQFLSAVDPLNDSIIDESNLKLVKANSAYPHKIMIGNTCQFSENINGEYVSCSKGVIDWVDPESNSMTSKQCPGCNGSGMTNRTSPTSVTLINPEDDESEIKAADAIRFIEPSTDIMKFLREEVKSHKKTARKNLFMPVKSDDSNVDQTATEVIQQNKAQQAYLNGVSDQIFHIYEFCLNAISKQRYNIDKMASLKKPQTFDFTTEKDFIAKIAELRESNVDPAVIQLTMMQYLKVIYETDEATTKVLNLYQASDSLMGISLKEISQKITQKTAARWQEILHCSFFSLVIELKSDNDNFFDQSIDDQIVQIQDLAKQKSTAIEGVSQEDLITKALTGGATG